LAKYKRLLNRVTKKIDKWHEEKSKLKECFQRDEEYIEHEQSPTQFDSSSEEEGIILESLGKRHINVGSDLDKSEGNSRASSYRKPRATAKTNPPSFKLSLLEAKA